MTDGKIELSYGLHWAQLWLATTSRQFHWNFHFTWKKWWLVAIQNLQSMKILLTLELSRFHKSGGMFSSSKPGITITMITGFLQHLTKKMVSNLCQICIYLPLNALTYIAIKNHVKIQILTNVLAWPGIWRMSWSGRAALVGQVACCASLISRWVASRGALVCHPPRPCQPWPLLAGGPADVGGH